MCDEEKLIKKEDKLKEEHKIEGVTLVEALENITAELEKIAVNTEVMCVTLEEISERIKEDEIEEDEDEEQE